MQYEVLHQRYREIALITANMKLAPEFQCSETKLGIWTYFLSRLVRKHAKKIVKKKPIMKPIA